MFHKAICVEDVLLVASERCDPRHAYNIVYQADRTLVTVVHIGLRAESRVIPLQGSDMPTVLNAVGNQCANQNDSYYGT